MSDRYIAVISGELEIRPVQARATMELLADGSTVPFIARYRKEVTGELDEVLITAVRDRLKQLQELDARREAILSSLEERELLTDELKVAIDSAATMAELEDLYLPYRPKRRTRATIAKEKGLEPLAQVIFMQMGTDPLAEAKKYIDEEKEVHSLEEALQGARDIIAEWISEDGDARNAMRELYSTKGVFTTSVIPGKEEEGAKFKDYFEWTEPLESAPSHRVLAMRRGERELILSLEIAPPENLAIAALDELFVRGATPASEQVRIAAEDSYKRLLGPSMETEIRVATKEKADAEAIRVFADNLRELLMASPLGEKRMLGIDPGFRTGCKCVCLDERGKLLYNDTIYPGQGEKRTSEAAAKILAMCEKYKVEVIAIGNGTASRETEAFINSLKLPDILCVMVNESGASIYSASEAAREEFPDYDLTVRGSVSIARRLMDPLAELVKIDAKSIGVGQYQHDVDQPMLKSALDDVVMSCVNGVGVEVNTASKQLLTYVSGLGPGLAQNIVDYRDENGGFKSRKELLKVKRLGPKAFEQAAGFLRLRDAVNPLDASAVHPESYHIVEKMAADLGCTVADLMADAALRAKINLADYVTDSVGMLTLTDIMEELAKPGRDPREKFEIFQFAEGVEKVVDLEVGMKLPGIVTNVTNFGAFVDVGVHQDGLVHISQLADRFVSDPADVVKVQQHVEVTVISVDLKRGRIGLSMRSKPKLGKKE